MVNEEGESTACKEEAEMEDGNVGSKKLSVKGGAAGLSMGQFVGEGEGLSGLTKALLHNATYMCGSGFCDE